MHLFPWQKISGILVRCCHCHGYCVDVGVKMPCFHQRRIPGCSPSSPSPILLMWLLECNNSIDVVIFLALLCSFPFSLDQKTEIFVNQIIKDEYVPFGQPCSPIFTKSVGIVHHLLQHGSQHTLYGVTLSQVCCETWHITSTLCVCACVYTAALCAEISRALVFLLARYLQTKHIQVAWLTSATAP